jgi:2-dehydropantoate 2-reductase
MEHLIGGVTWLSAAIEGPGVIGHYSQFHRVVIGEFDGKITERLKTIYKTLLATGITVEMSDDIFKVLWTKFVFISSISALGGLTRATIGEYRQVRETRDVLIEALKEVAAMAQAMGVTLEGDLVDKTLEFIDNAAPDMKTSMQRDVESGQPGELESMIGIVPRMGKQTGASTPVMGLAYAVLKSGNLKAPRR